MKYNQAGIAFMPKAPKTAEATAITILRSLSHQFDFVAIRFKLRVRLKTMIRACPNAVPHKKGKRDEKKSGKSENQQGTDYPSGFSSSPLLPPLPPEELPSAGLSSEKATFAGLRVAAVLPFTSFSSLSGTKRIFTLEIFLTVQSSDFSTPGQRNVM